MTTTTDSKVGNVKNPANSKPQPPSGKNFSDSVSDGNPQGFADASEPAWAPPEHQPEPRPTEPILDNPTPTNPSP